MNLLRELLERYMIKDHLPPGRVDATIGVGCSLTQEGHCAAQTREVAEEAAILFLYGGHSDHLVFLGDGYRGTHDTTEATEMAEQAREHPFHPFDLIVVPHGSNTWENAQDIARLCDDEEWTSVLIVADPIHTRRVLAAVRKAAPSLEVFVKKTPLSEYGDSDKWQLKSHWRFLLWEVACLAYFKLRGWA